MENFELINGNSPLHKLIGELIFSEFLFDKSIDYYTSIKNSIKEQDKVSEIDINKMTEKIINIKKHIPNFIDNCAQEILNQHPKIIGFSSSYFQSCSSQLWLDEFARIGFVHHLPNYCLN